MQGIHIIRFPMSGDTGNLIAKAVDSNNCTDLRSPANKIPFISKSSIFFLCKGTTNHQITKKKKEGRDALYMLVIMWFCNHLVVSIVGPFLLYLVL